MVCREDRQQPTVLFPLSSFFFFCSIQQPTAQEWVPGKHGLLRRKYFISRGNTTVGSCRIYSLLFFDSCCPYEIIFHWLKYLTSLNTNIDWNLKSQCKQLFSFLRSSKKVLMLLKGKKSRRFLVKYWKKKVLVSFINYFSYLLWRLFLHSSEMGLYRG